MSLLRVDRLSKSYAQRNVVQNVSFSIESGQVVGLLGPNGAGKTTSFYMVVGIVKPDSGEVELDGLPIVQLPLHRRARVGLSYLAQEPSIFRKLTVAENLEVALEAHDYQDKQRLERMEELLVDFRIQHIRDSLGFTLSGGERRRVEIARAIAGQPKFLLLDEPFAGIDPIAVGDIQQIIRDLRSKGIGILITDHNVRETLRICDYAYILKDGKTQVQGTASDIANNELAKQFYLGENFQL